MQVRIQIEGDASERLRLLAFKDVSRARREMTEDSMRQTLQHVVSGHPVRTGRSRAAWESCLNQIGSGASTGGAGGGEGRLVVFHGESISDASATSTVEYAKYLEYGTSKMAPFSMVRRALADAARSVRQLFRLSR